MNVVVLQSQKMWSDTQAFFNEFVVSGHQDIIRSLDMTKHLRCYRRRYTTVLTDWVEIILSTKLIYQSLYSLVLAERLRGVMCKNTDRPYWDQNVSVPTSNPAVLLPRTMLTVFQWMMLQQFCSWIRHTVKSEDQKKWRGTTCTLGISTQCTLLEQLPLLVHVSMTFSDVTNHSYFLQLMMCKIYTFIKKGGSICRGWRMVQYFTTCYVSLFGDIKSLLMCGGVFCLLSCILPLGFPYQFLPLLLLGLSVKVKKSEWQFLVGYLPYFFMIWLLMLTEMHEYRCLSAATLSGSPNYCLMIASQEVVGHIDTFCTVKAMAAKVWHF